MCGGTRTRAPAGVRSWSSPATRQFRCSTNCSPCRRPERCAASPEVELDESDGMPARCVLSLDNISLVRSTLLTERIARLAPPRMKAVCDAPCHHDRLLNRARGAKFVAAPLAAVAISIRERRRAHRARGTDRSERSCDRRAARPGTATGGLVRQLRARRAERRADDARHQGGAVHPAGRAGARERTAHPRLDARCATPCRRQTRHRALDHHAADLDRAAGPRGRAGRDATLPVPPQGSITPGAPLLQDRPALLAVRARRATEGRSLARPGR